MDNRKLISRISLLAFLGVLILTGCQSVKTSKTSAAKDNVRSSVSDTQTSAIKDSSVPAGTIAVVDPTIQYQKIEGWGVSLAWWAHVFGGAPNKVRQKVADLIFSEKEGLGLNVIRYNIGGGENPKYHFEEPRADMPGFESPSGKFNWKADANQRWMLQAAKQRGANMFEAFSNSPPYWMTVSGSVTGSKIGASDNLKDSKEKAFAQYLTKVVQHFHEAWGIDFHSLEAFNEPASGWWKLGGRQEGSHFSYAMQQSMIPLLHEDLADAKLKTAISAPDDNSINETVQTWKHYPQNIKQIVGQINTHSYNGTSREQLSAAAVKSGKNLWMSEYGDGEQSGMKMSMRILADLKQLKPTAWVYWQAIDGGGWGLLNADVNHDSNYSFTMTEKYYVLGNYSKFIRPGFRLVKIGIPNAVAAYQKSTNKLVIVTTNQSSSKETYTYDLSKFSNVQNNVQVYQTSYIEYLQKQSSISLHDKKFTASGPAQSVTTYVISGVQM